jgi:hypothetical protein
MNYSPAAQHLKNKGTILVVVLTKCEQTNKSFPEVRLDEIREHTKCYEKVITS